TRGTRRTAASRCPGRGSCASCGSSAPGRASPSRPADGLARLCIILTPLYTSNMKTAAILGCAGYAGQETLDRVLAHPELQVVAVGSDSLAGQAAGALDPRLNGSLDRKSTRL